MTAGLPERQASMARAVRGADLAAAPVQVRFVADLVCPWCYIAFSRLGRLLGDAELTWHPFLLNPTLPLTGVARTRYLERKFGSLPQAQSLYRRIQEVGAREGIRFSFASIRAQPNTVRAHGLVLAAAASGRARFAAATLFRAFFEEGADIGDPLVLAGVASALDLKDAALGVAQADQVAASHRAAAAFGINGVPITVLGEDHVIAGAQPVEALTGLLDLERYRRSPGSPG
jgi:predicted DsbA family dithiol-disulfide isomerase